MMFAPARRTLPSCLLALLLACVAIATAAADEVEERRVAIGLKIFPRLVAVDNDLDRKLTADGTVLLIFVYEGDDSRAAESARQVLQQVPSIGGFPVAARAVSVADLDELPVSPSGLFISQQLGERSFRQTVGYARDQHILAFSPISGDVERGAAAGLYIRSRIRPYFNLTALRISGIEVNQRLLEISKHYD